MILVDTSCWVSFFRGEDTAKRISNLILENRSIIHPFVLGELLLGGISAENESLLQALTVCEAPSISGIYAFIKKYHLNGKGIGFVDVAILESCFAHNYKVITFDANLSAAAEGLAMLANL